MNPRRIEAAIDSICLLRGMIDQAWFTAYTEEELEIEIPRFVKETPEYTHYLIISDDVVVTQDALEAVLVGLMIYPALTGYCNIAVQGKERKLANLSKLPLVGEPPTNGSYIYPTLEEIQSSPDQYPITYFMGHTLTGLSRELMLRFPFRCYHRDRPADGMNPGFSSDYNLSYRLQKAGIIMRAARDAYCYHMGGPGSRYRSTFSGDFLTGKVKPSITLYHQSD